MMGIYSMKMKRNKLEKRELNNPFRMFIGILLLFGWGSIVVYITLIERGYSAVSSYNLHLFWCIKEAWIMKNPFDWYFIVGNVLMFMPLGIILPICFDFMQSWWKASVAGFAISVSVELMQLIFHLGFFEFDDMFHNTLGTFMGYGVFVLLLGICRKEWIETKWTRRLLFLVWVLVAGFLIVAVLSGQPVFEKFLSYML